MLVVVLIITILATIVGVRVANRPAEARLVAARAQIVNFRNAMQLYRLDNGRFPTTQQGLAALREKPEVEPVPQRYRAEGYLDSRHVPPDPWGNPYVYLSPGPDDAPYVIVSYGGNGEPGGEGEDADISSLDM
jgi:general secretion pathway protein G